MRKLLFSLFFILSGAGAFGAAPWGAMADYDQKTDDSPWANRFHGGYAYLIPQIITGPRCVFRYRFPPVTKPNARNTKK